MEVISLDVATYDENGNRIWGPNVGLIVGVTIAAVVVCVIIIAIIAFCVYRSRKNSEMQQVQEQSQDFSNVKY